MRFSSPIYMLKRQAKTLARANDIRLYVALNQIAVKEGFRDWSHLASSYSKATPTMEIMRQLNSGDLVLIGARPGHGKTLLGLELAALAKKNSRKGCVFSLDYNETDVWGELARLGFERNASNGQILVDTSDEICADYIIECLGNSRDNALIVVDYLQLLDQRRSNPPLAEQIRALKSYAIDRGAIVVLISQIDRAFELSSRVMPGVEDVRLPNPVDLSLFDMRCFLHDGDVRMEKAA